MKNDKRLLTARVGNINQIAYVRRSVISEGKADGMRMIDIDNGGGLSCSLLESRALDIARLNFKGINIGFLAKPGLLAPSSVVSGEFTRYFYGGMLYTCGLSNIGYSSTVDGNILPMHGRIGITPAQDITAKVNWDKGEILISGTMRQSALFGQNLSMHRQIIIPLFDSRINIKDTITNNGFADEDIMLLYHFNFGWPMLDANSRLLINSDINPRNDDAKSGLDNWNTFEEPTPKRPEEVFYHTPKVSEDGLVHAKLNNKKLNLAAEIIFDKNELPELIQWKSMASGDYALGIEPATARVGGYHAEKKAGRIIKLAPGEDKSFNVLLKLSDEI